MWNNKAAIESLKQNIAKILNRFSDENLVEFKDFDAELFNDEINFELDDSDRLEHAFAVHMKASHVSSFTQVIAMTMLAEGSSGKTFKQIVIIYTNNVGYRCLF